MNLLTENTTLHGHTSIVTALFFLLHIRLVLLMSPCSLLRCAMTRHKHASVQPTALQQQSTNATAPVRVPASCQRANFAVVQSEIQDDVSGIVSVWLPTAAPSPSPNPALSLRLLSLKSVSNGGEPHQSLSRTTRVEGLVWEESHWSGKIDNVYPLPRGGEGGVEIVESCLWRWRGADL